MQNWLTRLTRSQFALLIVSLIVVDLFVLVLVWISAFKTGVDAGIQQYMAQCTRYPFLLLDPNQFIACPIVTP